MYRVGNDSKGKCGYLVDWADIGSLEYGGGNDQHPD